MPWQCHITLKQQQAVLNVFVVVGVSRYIRRQLHHRVYVESYHPSHSPHSPLIACFILVRLVVVIVLRVVARALADVQL